MWSSGHAGMREIALRARREFRTLDDLCMELKGNSQECFCISSFAWFTWDFGAIPH